MSHPPKLLVITSPLVPFERLCTVASEMAALGPQVALLYREPGISDGTYEARARTLSGCGMPLFLHGGRVELALALGANLHLPVHAPTPGELRPHFPLPRLISTSVHDTHELRVRGTDADFVLISPVHSPGSKPDDRRPTLGHAGFHLLASKAGCPAVALGGMTPAHTRALRPAGVAAIGAIWNSEEPVTAARAFLEALR